MQQGVKYFFVVVTIVIVISIILMLNENQLLPNLIIFLQQKNKDGFSNGICQIKYEEKFKLKSFVAYIKEEEVTFPFGRCQLNCLENIKICTWIKKGVLDKRILAVLLAIHFGASHIFFTDENKTPDLSRLTFSSESREMVYQGDGTEFSVEMFTNNESIPISFLQKRTSEIQTPFLKTFQIDDRAPDITLPKGIFFPYELTNTLFSYSAFWSLLATKPLECQTWLSFLNQRLLWEIGGTVKFNMHKGTGANSIPPSASKDLEKKLLTEWECPNKFSFLDCVRLVVRNFTSNPCGSYYQMIMNDWIDDLNGWNYQEPKRQKPNITLDTNMYYTPVILTKNEGNGVSQGFSYHHMQVKSLCTKYSSKLIYPSLKPHVFDNLILLIVFNKPHYDNIPKLQLAYSEVFPRIVYCGSDIKRFLTSAEKFSENVTFVEAEVYSGNFNYICMARVIEMGYSVDGYLFIGDDTLLNARIFEKFPLSKPWIVGFDPFRRSWKYHKWGNWNAAFGRRAFLAGWEELEQSSRSSPERSESFKKLQKNLLNNTGFDDGLETIAADFYYFPAKYQKDLIFYINHFYKHKLFLEIAVGTIMAGIAPKTGIEIIHGKYLWSGADRQNYDNFYNNDLPFLHPVKFSRELKSEKGLKFFCERYFPFQLYGRV